MSEHTFRTNLKIIIRTVPCQRITMDFFDESDEDDNNGGQKSKGSMLMSLESLKGDGGSGDNDENDQGDKSSIDHQRDDDGCESATSKVAATKSDDDNDTTNKNCSPNKDNKTGSQSVSHNGDDDAEEEEVDPLDAYMNSLNKNGDNASRPKPGSQTGVDPGGRMDMENEEEATVQWEASRSSAPSEPASSHPEAETNSAHHAASQALQSTFHRASNQEEQSGQPNGDRDVNIQLQHVQHDTMGYSSFKKCFLDLQEEPKSDEGNSSKHPRSNRSTYEGQKWRKQHAVWCNPPLDPIYDFAELRDVLPRQVMEWNTRNNLTKPTLVQSQTLGVALCGKDAIITASTGSGKTLSYLWPLVTHLMENDGKNQNNDGPNSGRPSRSRALVLVPTRELALQVEQVAKSLLANLPLTALAITGGNMGRYQLSQKLQSSKPHLIVATPGRLLDVLSALQKTKQDWLLPNITFLVMDEADKMISLGFANQVTQLLQSMRPDRQSLLTSATFDSRLQRRCQEWMHAPTRISIGKTGESSKHVKQHVVCLPTVQAKLDFLKQSLPTFVEVGRTLIFCRTREGVDKLSSELKMVLSVETMHGDKHPTDRKAALKAFAEGKVKVLVATDVAGRGLDIPEVSTVINYDPAKNWDTHVHRIGRAGRLSSQEQQRQEGSAYTLLLPSNIDFAKALIRAYEREGRAVPDDVRSMANRNSAKRPQNGGDRKSANDSAGVGYYGDANRHNAGDSNTAAAAATAGETSSKKGRWGW